MTLNDDMTLRRLLHTAFVRNPCNETFDAWQARCLSHAIERGLDVAVILAACDKERSFYIRRGQWTGPYRKIKPTEGPTP